MTGRPQLRRFGPGSLVLQGLAGARPAAGGARARHVLTKPPLHHLTGRMGSGTMGSAHAGGAAGQAGQGAGATAAAAAGGSVSALRSGSVSFAVGTRGGVSLAVPPGVQLGGAPHHGAGQLASRVALDNPSYPIFTKVRTPRVSFAGH